MMRKLITTLLFPVLYTAVFAAPPSVGTPPEISANDSGQLVENDAPAVAPKELTEEEMQKMRKDLDAAKLRSPNPMTWPKTKIEEVVDNNNVVQEVKVTPGSTQIPYTMTRQPPSGQTQNGPGGDNIMSTPKFINFGF